MKEELPLHDATFDGIIISGRNCILYFTQPDGSGCEVELGSVEALQMEDFRKGNIIVLFEKTMRELPGPQIDLQRLYTPLCRARHNGVYAERHTMPSGSNIALFSQDLRVIGSA